MHIKTVDTKWPETLFDDDEPRQEGLHLGAVIKDIENKMHPGKYSKSSWSDIKLTAEIGLLWERVLSMVMADKYGIRPPQIQKDGIWMSPDGLNADPEGEVPMVIEEYKATWQSNKRCPSENWYYMTQVKSYCHAYETPIAIMHIFHVMGNYKGSGPIYRVSRCKFSRKELTDNWKMIVQHKESMQCT